jgi:hypothetical protein
MTGIFDKEGFWVILGVLIGSAINHLFWLVQTKRQEKLQIRSDRQAKIAEICDFCSVLNGKVKVIYSLTITGAAKDYFFKHMNFWEDVPLYKTRMTIQMFFPKSVDIFDDLQISLSELIKAMDRSMRNEPLTYGELDGKINSIFKKINDLQNNIIDNYSKVLNVT